jgi:hypothetical protein
MLRLAHQLLLTADQLDSFSERATLRVSTCEKVNVRNTQELHYGIRQAGEEAGITFVRAVCRVAVSSSARETGKVKRR